MHSEGFVFADSQAVARRAGERRLTTLLKMLAKVVAHQLDKPLSAIAARSVAAPQGGASSVGVASVRGGTPGAGASRDQAMENATQRDSAGCAAVSDGVAALLRCARWPLEGVDGDLWARLREVLPRIRWVPAHLSLGAAAACGVLPSPRRRGGGARQLGAACSRGPALQGWRAHDLRCLAIVHEVLATAETAVLAAFRARPRRAETACLTMGFSLAPLGTTARHPFSPVAKALLCHTAVCSP